VLIAELARLVDEGMYRLTEAVQYSCIGLWQLRMVTLIGRPKT
jgi:hypothetical protein